MDTPATSQKHTASSLLNAKARQPTASVVSISPPRAWYPPSTDNDFMPGREGVIAREIVASHVYISPPVFCTKAKVAKGGAYLQDTTVLVSPFRKPYKQHFW